MITLMIIPLGLAVYIGFNRVSYSTFNKPVFVTNMYALHTDTYPRGNYDRGILKKMYWKSSMERISIIDFIKLVFDLSLENSISFKKLFSSSNISTFKLIFFETKSLLVIL